MFGILGEERRGSLRVAGCVVVREGREKWYKISFYAMQEFFLCSFYATQQQQNPSKDF